MASAGTLEIQMLANMARLSKDMGEAKGMVGGAMKNIESSVSAAKSALGALGLGLSAAMFVNLVKGSIDAMDKLNDLSKSTGLTVEQLAGLKVAAKQSGGDLDSIAQSINKLSVEMGKAPEKFRALGVSAKDPLEAFKQLSDIFVSIDNPQQRAALGAAALGKAWAGAAPLLAEGSANITEMVAAGTKLSGMTTKAAQDADKLNDQMVLLETSFQAVKDKIAITLLPQMTKIADEMARAAKEGAGFWGTMVRGWQMFATGDDLQKSSAELVGLTDALLTAQNLLAKAKASGAVSDTARHTAEVARLNERIKLVMGYRSLLETPAAAAAGVAKVPGAGAKAGAFLDGGKAATDAAKADEALAKQRAKASDDIAAEAYKRWQERMRAQLQEAKDIRTADFENAVEMGNQMRGLFEADIERKLADDQAAKDRQAADLEALRVSLFTEDEIRKFSYENDFNLLNNTLGMKAEAQEEYYTLMGRLVRKNALETLLVERQKNEAVRSQQVATWQAGAELLQQFAGESKAAAIAVIAINKALAIAQVMMNIPVAQARAFAELGPVAGAAASATIGAWGAVQIGLIAATGLMQAANVGGGGADLGSPANPVSTQPGLGANQASGAGVGNGQTTIINLPNQAFYSRKQVKEFMQAISENSRDGGRVVVN